MQEIKNVNGKYKTLAELYDDAVEIISEALDYLSDSEQIEIGNKWRDDNGYPILHYFEEDEVDEVLSDCSPWDIIHMEIETSYCGDRYFTYEYDFEVTDDIWDNIDLEDLARELINGEASIDNREINDLISEYEDAKEYLENLNEDREAAREVLAKFVNCEADWKDLFTMLDKLVKNDDIWE